MHYNVCEICFLCFLPACPASHYWHRSGFLPLFFWYFPPLGYKQRSKRGITFWRIKPLKPFTYCMNVCRCSPTTLCASRRDFSKVVTAAPDRREVFFFQNLWTCTVITTIPRISGWGYHNRQSFTFSPHWRGMFIKRIQKERFTFQLASSIIPFPELTDVCN